MDIELGSFDSEFHIGQVYDDKKGLKQKLSLYVVKHNFQFKIVHSSTTIMRFIAFVILANGNSVPLTRSCHGIVDIPSTHHWCCPIVH